MSECSGVQAYTFSVGHLAQKLSLTLYKNFLFEGGISLFRELLSCILLVLIHLYHK